jgi:hypothetical protein
MGFNRAGKIAGYVRKDGYRYITIDGVEYRADQIVWKLVHGEDPPGDLEHINGDRADDRIANLRPKQTS